MTTLTLDPARLEAFGERVGGIVNDGFLALALSVGHRTGLFDALAELPPSTTDEIARASGLQERYVREILGALAAGGIVEYDPGARTFALPSEAAAFVTRAAGINNLAAVTGLLVVCAAVEDDVVRCFREGGGVPYERYTRFHEVMAEASKDQIDATFLGAVLALIDGLRGRLEAGIDVADIGCGAGYAMNVLAREFPHSRFSGFDLSEEAIGRARAQAQEWGLSNVTFEVRDVTDLDLTDAFDWVTTLDAVHDQADPARVLANIARALRPDGVYLCVDIAASSHLEDNLDHPFGAGLYTISTMHCMTVSLAQGGAGLGTCWGEQTALAMLADAGFGTVRTEHVEGDVFNVYYVAQK